MTTHTPEKQTAKAWEGGDEPGQVNVNLLIEAAERLIFAKDSPRLYPLGDVVSTALAGNAEAKEAFRKYSDILYGQVAEVINLAVVLVPHLPAPLVDYEVILQKALTDAGLQGEDGKKFHEVIY